MEASEISIRRLREALERRGFRVADDAILTRVMAHWTQAAQCSFVSSGELRAEVGGSPDPVSALDTALHLQGFTMEEQELTEIAWALLGVLESQRLSLGTARWARLTHLTEMHDVSLPSAARVLGRQLAQEPHLIRDLLRVRPWLRETGRERGDEVLAAVFENEWSGFLALLGEVGPWVYVPHVSDLQVLSHLYTRLVHAAASTHSHDLLTAALRFRPPEESLLVRLESTDYRLNGKNRRSSAKQVQDPLSLREAERAFWETAELRARGRRDEWTKQRGGLARRP